MMNQESDVEDEEHQIEFPSLYCSLWKPIPIQLSETSFWKKKKKENTVPILDL